MTEQIEDTTKVKITKEKSQPRDQANRNSPDSRSLRNSSWAFQSLVVAQRQDPTVQSVLQNVEIHQVQWRQVPTVRVPHMLHKDKFVNRRIVTYRQVHTDSKTSRKQRKRHMFSSLIVWKKFLKFDAGTNDTKKALKEKLTSQSCRGNRACVGSCFLRSESADEDGLNIQTAQNREGSPVASD